MPLEIFASGRDDPCWSPQAEDAPIRKHSTPSRLLRETAQAAGSSRSTVGRLQGYPSPRPNPVRARPARYLWRGTVAGPRKPFQGREGALAAGLNSASHLEILLATPPQPKRCRLCSILYSQAVCHADCSRRLRTAAASPVVHSGCAGSADRFSYSRPSKKRCPFGNF
jgi:hypothetical protein